MQFSRLVFPAPQPPTYSSTTMIGELLYVPKDFSDCPYKYISKEHRYESRRSLTRGRRSTAGMGASGISESVRANPFATI